jgi:hypothetical protein
MEHVCVHTYDVTYNYKQTLFTCFMGVKFEYFVIFLFVYKYFQVFLWACFIL